MLEVSVNNSQNKKHLVNNSIEKIEKDVYFFESILNNIEFCINSTKIFSKISPLRGVLLFGTAGRFYIDT